jgi:hypothetical protein
MEISIASNNQVRAIETFAGISSLPEHISENSAAKDLIALIKDYYVFLNQQLGPSNAISNLVKDHDIDLASESRLDSIERCIAAAVPKSAIDRRRLLKNIATYYNSRGSEDSIFSFFKIFYNEIVTLVYPKESLFQTSNDKGKASDRFRVQDSHKWQDFSYIVNTSLGASVWKNEFLRFVHPAGLKFFAALTVEAANDNDWSSLPPQSYLYDPESPVEMDDFWKNIDWDRLAGRHTPKMQAGAESVFDFLSKVFLGDGGKHYLTHVRSVYNERSSDFVDRDLLSSFFTAFTITCKILNDLPSVGLVHNDWIVGGKFRDLAKWGDGWTNLSIEESDQTYRSGLEHTFSGTSPYIKDDGFFHSVTEPLVEDPEDPWVSTLDTDVAWTRYTSSETGYNNSFVHSDL